MLRVQGVETQLLAFDVPATPEAPAGFLNQLAEYLVDGWAVVASGGGDHKGWLILARPEIGQSAGIEVPNVDMPWPITRPPGSGGRPA
jgi:hypothetical protein